MGNHDRYGPNSDAVFILMWRNGQKHVDKKKSEDSKGEYTHEKE